MRRRPEQRRATATNARRPAAPVRVVDAAAPKAAASSAPASSTASVTATAAPPPAPSPTAPTASTTAPSSSSAVATARAKSPPQFARLLLTGFQAVGITYMTMERLRRAKKNALDATELPLLWKCLHDLVLVALVDFRIDTAEMARENDPESLTRQLADPAALAMWQELVRYYLFHWGFACRVLYEPAVPPTSDVLLLAIAWLVAHTRFFERLRGPILERYLQGHALVLPPYPNAVRVPDERIERALQDVRAAHEGICARLDAVRGTTSLADTTQQVQVAFGRLRHHLTELEAHVRCHRRLLQKLEDRQRAMGATDDELLPAYAVQLLASSGTDLELHLRLLRERLQMIEDEKLFYKWIHSIRLTTDDSTPPFTTDNLAHYEQLERAIATTRGVFEANVGLLNELASSYKREWKLWKQEAKSRNHIYQMEQKMEALVQSIAATELVDVRTLFLARGPQATTAMGATTAAAPVSSATMPSPPPAPVPSEVELESLRSQLDRVLQEITQEQCGVRLM